MADLSSTSKWEASSALGLGDGTLNEFFSATASNAQSLVGLMLGCAFQASSRSTLLVRQHFLGVETGEPYPFGLIEFGIDPARIIFVAVQDVQSALQAGLEGARCSALGAVLIELRGEARAYDLTASRRLALAAKASGTLVFLSRTAARPYPSAAETRWQVAAASSRPLAANAPGNPAYDLTLLRARNRQEGARYHVEWDRNARTFIARASDTRSHAAKPDTRQHGERPPLSGAVAPLPFDRQGATQDAPPSHRQAG
ncbi:MAG: hypothetical protein HXY22_06945 [Alphaproteobacteria bacterium]|nr:hypothetical protein [Alphaproteobacteria bacterium]